ncbi:MAG TPA: response regulator transcription factor [Solirubrobacteraceae bacterium]|nr:response regulator transcription factor [Solirubrobacteraceae bacterium]
MPAAPESQPRASVLVVDDEPTIGEVLARYLQRAGYDTRVAGDGPQALALSAQRAPDLVVLDIMLPGIDGLEVMRRLHERAGETTCSAPAGAPVHAAPRVILLTARGREAERIVGLRRGADDYVVKPFSPGELVARVEAVLRRARSGGGDATRAAHDPAPALEFDGLRVEPTTRRVLSGAREVALTAREFDLLAFLARHPGQVFSRDRLMELVWQLPDYTDSSTVTVHIRRLRAKIEPNPERPRYVQTVWGVGYRFQA